MNRFRAALTHPLGVAIGDMLPPEQIGATARWIEAAGYSHLTVPEDCFYLPAQVGATLALTATERVPVGTSIVSALTRHPAIMAMEIAGLSRAFPGRFWPGIGLGLPPWLEQMGLMPRSRSPPCGRRSNRSSSCWPARRCSSRARPSPWTRSPSPIPRWKRCRSRWG